MGALMDFEAVGACILLAAAWIATEEWLLALMLEDMGVEVAFGDEVLAALLAYKRPFARLCEAFLT